MFDSRRLAHLAGPLTACAALGVAALSGCAASSVAAVAASSDATTISTHARAHTSQATATHADTSSTSARHTDRQRTARATPTVGSKKTALGALATLPVKGRAPMTGYSRDQFGPAWDDAAGNFPGWTRNGCDTRSDVLNRDLTAKVYRAGTGGCIVESGTRKVEPYTGIPNYRYVRGGSYAQGLDIDHVTALGDAWQTGAQQWTLAKRESLANDPVNLLAVDPSQNRQKGDADAASWLPANKSFRCTYVAIQVTVKAKYGLWVTSAEKAAMQRILRACPNQPLATTTPLPATAQPVSQPVATTTATPAATSPGSGAATPSGCEPGYSPCLPVTTDLNCSDIPASKKPVHVTGDDPYRLDADHDGLGCTS